MRKIPLIALVVLVIVVQFVLPPIAKWQINRELSKLPDYRGHVEDVDVHPFLGEIELEKVWFAQRFKDKEAPIFYAEEVATRIAFSSLLRARLESNVRLRDPVMLYVEGVTLPNKSKEPIEKIIRNWRAELQELLPFKVRELEITNGTLLYRLPVNGDVLPVDVNDIFIKVTNLTNKPKSKEDYVANAYVGANIPGNGEVELNIRFVPMSNPPMFDLDSQIKHVDLVAYNRFFKKFAKFDLERGEFNLAAEAAIKNNYVRGYIKPLFSRVKVVGKQDEDDHPFRKLWESVVGAGAEVLKNSPKDRLAAKIPFEGPIGGPEVDIWSSVVSVLSNAVRKALTPGVENTVSLR